MKTAAKLTFIGIALLTLVLAAGGSSWAAADRGVRLTSTQLTGTVNKPVTIRIEVPAKELPSGHMYSAAVDVLSTPSGAVTLVILPAFPNIAVTAQTAGEYQLRVRVNLIEKTSCGGASFQPLLSQKITMRIAP